MSDDTGNPSDGRRFRPHRDRPTEETDQDYRRSRDFHERPNAISLFLRLGYDITQNDDVIRLAEDLRWAAERRRVEKETKPKTLAFIGSSIVAFLSVGLTILGQWILTKITTGRP